MWFFRGSFAGPERPPSPCRRLPVRLISKKVLYRVFFLRGASLRHPPLVTVLLEIPLTIVQRADLAGLQPTGNAVEVERMVADAPGHGALLAGGRCLVGLALDAQVHDVVAANGAIVHHDVCGGYTNEQEGKKETGAE